MPATVHVIARFLPKPGHEDAVQAALTAAIAPTRRELGCYQYDLLVTAGEPREFCFVERWDGDASLDKHLETAHLKALLQRVEGLLAEAPDIRRHRLV